MNTDTADIIESLHTIADMYDELFARQIELIADIYTSTN